MELTTQERAHKFELIHLSEWGTAEERMTILLHFTNFLNSKSARFLYPSFLQQAEALESPLPQFEGIIWKGRYERLVDMWIDSEYKEQVEKMVGVELKPYIHPTTGNVSYELVNGKYKYIYRQPIYIL